MKCCSDRNHGCRYMAFRLGETNVLLLENEKFRVMFLPDNGCDIADINYKPLDVSFLWRTRQGLSSLDNSRISLTDKFNQTYHGGWFEAFPNVGLACNYNGIAFEPYDEVKNLKWNYQIMKDESEEIVVKFSASTLKTPFTLEKNVRILSGSMVLTMEEIVTNTGKECFPFQWGHHPLLGYPFLSGDCVIDFPGADIDTFFEFNNARVEQGIKGTWPSVKGKNGDIELDRFPAPGSDVNDLYWLSDLKSNWMGVRNEKLNLGIGFAWDEAVFDHCLLWINANGDKGYPHFGDAYTLCIMPSTSGTHTIEAEAKNGTIRFLKPGESIGSWITTAIFVPGKKTITSIDKNGKVNLNSKN
ncbi:MAG: DUF4432 family protein [Bacteroidota bacterium]